MTNKMKQSFFLLFFILFFCFLTPVVLGNGVMEGLKVLGIVSAITVLYIGVFAFAEWCWPTGRESK